MRGRKDIEREASRGEVERGMAGERRHGQLPHVAGGLLFVVVLSWQFASTPHGVSQRPLDRRGAAEATVSTAAPLLETGRAAKLVKLPSGGSAPPEIKVVSYNIRWRGGEDLRELVRLLREDHEIGQASIIGLQEVDRNRKRTGNINTARLMAEELGMYYAWAAPPLPAFAAKKKKKKQKEQEEETGVCLLSPYPLTDVEPLVLPHEGPDGRRRAAIGATVHIGERLVRVYSVHAETRLESEKKLEQLRAVLDSLARHPKIEGAIVLGDFNTWKGGEVDRTDRMFRQAGFQTPFSKEAATWKDYWFIELKLDWIWLRGLQARSSGIDKAVKLSDHWPLWLDAGFEKQASPPTTPPASQFVR